MNYSAGRQGFWQPLQRGAQGDESYLATLRREADQRAEEASALLDQAEAPECQAQEREALLFDTSELWRYAVASTDYLASADRRLRRLKGKREGSEESDDGLHSS